MKLVAEYLERSVQFERMAAEADDLNLKEQLLEQAAAYRKLAETRAALLGKAPPPMHDLVGTCEKRRRIMLALTI
jgi:hypothetical protein